MSDQTTTQASASADRPKNCSYCQDSAAEMDRQRHRQQLDAFDLDMLAKIDHAQMQAERLCRLVAEQAAGRAR